MDDLCEVTEHVELWKVVMGIAFDKFQLIGFPIRCYLRLPSYLLFRWKGLQLLGRQIWIFPQSGFFGLPLDRLRGSILEEYVLPLVELC
mgnify:FL=1